MKTLIVDPQDLAVQVHRLAQSGAAWSVDDFDLSPMAQTVSIDAQSGVAHVRSGARWADIEAELAGHQLTLGPLPSWMADHTVLQTFAANDRLRPSPLYGQLTDAVLAVRAVLPDGRLTRSTVAPRRATGPDLGRLVIGTHHRYGILTDVHLRIWPQPQAWLFRQTSFSGWSEAAAGVRRVLDAGVHAAWWRLIRDKDQVMLSVGLSGLNESLVKAAGTRYDTVIGGCVHDSAKAADLEGQIFASKAPPTVLHAAIRCRPDQLGESMRGRRGAQVWDLGRTAMTIYTPRMPKTLDYWAPLADDLARAMGGEG